MRKPHALAAVLVGAMALAAPAARGAPTTTRKQLDDVIRQLHANAERWWNDQDIRTEAEIALKSLWFDETSVGYLTEALKAQPNDPNGLYVINRLLRQLSFVKTAPIRVALPTVKDLHSRHKPFVKLSARQIKALKKPSGGGRNARAAMEQRRREKVQKEKVIAKHNQMVAILEVRTFKLMLLAKSPEEDELLCQWLVNAEKQRSAIFLILVEGLAADARHMSKERAENVYKLLRPCGVEVKMQQKTGYVDRGRAKIRPDDASTYDVRREYPGIKLLAALNRIATASRMPALKVPKDKDIKKYHADRAKKKPRPRSRR